MNKLIHTAPPSALGRWLGRSLAWTVACVLPCAGLWYWVMVVKNADCRSCGTSMLLTPLTVVLLVGAKVFHARAIAGFGPLFQQAPENDWAKSIGLCWSLVLRLLLGGWLVLNSLMVLLMLFSWLDDGENMWVN